MHALVVRFDVIPERLEDFDALVRVTQAGIRDHEDGTLVYTSMAMVDDPCARVFIEMYRDEDAFARHEEMAHTREFLAARESMLRSLRVERLHTVSSLDRGPDGP